MATILCRVDEIAAGSGKEVATEGPDGRFWVALFRVGEDIRAYVNACPHMGRALCFAPDEFLIEEGDVLVCPHHGACFELATGTCISGPCAGAFLTPVEIGIDGEQVCFFGVAEGDPPTAIG